MKLVALVLALSALLAPPPAARPQGDGAVLWRGDFDAATAEAKAANKPIFIAFIMDQEPANDEIVKNHFHDPKVVAMSKNFVCLIANTWAHDSGPNSASSKAAICSRFGCVTCGEHQRVEMLVRTTFMDSPRVAAPQFLFLRPDGKTVLLRHVWTLGPDALVERMQTALSLHDPASHAPEAEKMKSTADALIAAASTNNAIKRRDAIGALATSDDPRVLDFLLKQCGENVEDQRRLEAIEAIGRQGGARTVAVLHKLLESSSQQIRLAVAKALVEIAVPDSGGPIFRALKKESRDRVRVELVRALCACDVLTPAHRKEVVALTSSSSQNDKIVALWALGRMSKGDDLTKPILRAIDDTNAFVRAMGYYAAGRLGIGAADSPIRKQKPQEKQPVVKNMAGWALGQLADDAYGGPDGEACCNSIMGTVGLN